MNKVIHVVLLLLSFSYVGSAQSIDSTQMKAQSVYTLGQVTIVSQKIVSSVSPLKELIKGKQDVSSSLKDLPSVWFVNYGSRNESSIHIRGFDTRAIPLYIDGIPVYIPYDGLIDLARFKNFGFSRIDVSQGLSPMALGPNAMGGAINLVSLKPQHKLEVQAMLGAYSGKGFQYGLALGSRMKKWYYQASYYHSQQEYFPLSDNYKAGPQEDGGQRENSYSKDHNLHVKIGFTPNYKSEYAINFSHIQGEKGNPPYSGDDPLNRARFWQWPQWDKTSIYFLSNTSIGSSTKLKIRLFYDDFDNTLESYDDSTYSSQNAKYAFTSFYDDFDYGGNVVLEMSQIKNNKLSLSAHFKSDNHSEHNLGEQTRNTSDNTLSIGLDDEYLLGNQWRLVAGLSYNTRKSVLAEDYFSFNDSIGHFDPYTGSAFNGQFSAKYYVNRKLNLRAGIAHKTRFSTMKERYSYKNGRGLPNPELKAEQATHYDMEINYKPWRKLHFTASAYYIYIQDVIQNIDEVQPGVSQMQNSGNAEFIGFDVNANYFIRKNLRFQATYSFIERSNLSQPQLYFTDIPQDKIQANVQWKPFKNFLFKADFSHYSDRYSTSYGIKAKAFQLINSSVSYFWKGFTFSGGINNLLDANYAYAEGFPAQGRNYFISTIFRLKME